MAKEYVVEIMNWKKYQNREIKTASVWLRLQNDFIDNPNFSEFSSDERVVWIHALCCASKLNTALIHVPLQCSHQRLYRHTGIDENTFHQTFQKLKKLQIVKIRTTRGRYAGDASEIADDTQTTPYEDVTLRRRYEDVTKTKSPKGYFDFESLYQKYPLKRGKAKGLAKAKTIIRTQEQFDALSKAIDRYAADIIARGVEAKFIQHFSTFMNGTWHEWLDADVGTTAAQQAEDHKAAQLAEIDAYHAAHGIKLG